MEQKGKCRVDLDFIQQANEDSVGFCGECNIFTSSIRKIILKWCGGWFRVEEERLLDIQTEKHEGFQQWR